MMNIAKLTLNGYSNYGNILQSYALEQILLNFNCNVDTIWIRPNDFLPLKKWNWKIITKYLLNWHGFKTYVDTGNYGMEIVRQGKIKDWAKSNLNLTDLISSINKLADRYDFFVVGSDQVWNPNLPIEVLKDYLLPEIPKDKCIAYAASISYPSIPMHLIETYIKGLSGFKSISMREEDGARLVKELVGMDVPVVLDPTLLVNESHWKQLGRKPAWYDGRPYSLTYFLGKRPANLQGALERKRNTINLLDAKNYDQYVTGIDEFIWAIQHAEHIYTDSFHGAVFSLLMHRPFTVYRRMAANEKDSAGAHMESRINNLLKTFNLAQDGTGILGISKRFDSINFAEFENILEREREKSLKFLSYALRGNI